jgi:hypothetical protein
MKADFLWFVLSLLVPMDVVGEFSVQMILFRQGRAASPPKVELVGEFLLISRSFGAQLLGVCLIFCWLSV